MYLIIGKKSDHKILNIQGITNVDISTYKLAIANSYGGISSDYSICILNEITYLRAIKGEEYTVTWVDDEIIGLDFSIYESKNKIRFFSAKSEILADGIEKSRISIKLKNLSDVDLSTNISGYYIPIDGPLNTVIKKVDFISGVAQFDFKSTIPGKYKIPSESQLQIGDYRIINYISIEALYN